MKLALILALATASVAATLLINPDSIRQAASRHSFDWFGLTVKEATLKAAAQSIPFRIVQEDGKPLPRTEDYRPGRINAHIHGNHLIAVEIEGQSQQITEGVIDTAHLQFLGLLEADAIALAKVAGLPFRVVAREGEHFPVTLDYMPKRANATVAKGIVIAITPG